MGLYRGYTGIMETNMESILMGLYRFMVQGLARIRDLSWSP